MFKAAYFLASAALAVAQSQTQQPCALVASRITQSPHSDCLDSVPVDTSGNEKLIEELKTVWQFQSELVWFKNPGDGWEYGPLDIIQELDNVKNSLSSFKSEYAVQLAIQNITVRTGNFHFNYDPDILQVFRFSRPLNVASISSDGKALPKLYVHDDVQELAAGLKTVSEIQQINGQNPYDFLKSTFFSQYIDSDGRMNNMFSKGDTNNQGAFSSQDKYDGNVTEIKWANGSTSSIPNIATSQYSFTGVKDGKSFFEKFCTGAIAGATTFTADADTKEKDIGAVSPSIRGPVPIIPHGNYHTRNKRQVVPTATYPEAVAEASSGVVAGYFLNGQGYQDVAVLKIISFSNPSASGETNFNNDFQATIKKFLAQCQSQSKTKLIIDLRENGGGNTNLLLDAFMQLFPQLEPFSGQRYRAHDAWLKIGEAVNEIRSDNSIARSYRSLMRETIENTNVFRFWAYWHFRRADGTNFESWDEFNGPVQLNSDELTVTMRYNYSSADRISIVPTGFNFVNGTRPSIFDAKNVVMFTDALCGSSCASFHEELKNIAGVRAVTVGGLPENKPIQTVTGSKGGEVVPMFTFPQYASDLLNLSSEIGISSVKSDDATLSALANVPRIATRAGDSQSRVQSQDQIRKGDSSATPLQFIYEAADCKIFYTPKTYSDPDLAWKQAWDAFVNDTNCVPGSTKHNSSISGGFKPFGAAGLTANDQPDAPASNSGGPGQNGAAASVRVSGALVAFVGALMAAVMM
ncbi:hypothetical protein SNOG_05177 [Parastagonospora nodorum SN15]|uniref:Uncharacterized protein n=1 Tax=Phaeosphaeria nodorum (strain SN15 / ATCC MYA-4574 / FGSC 10173) TaxID=321614 RepID=Q0UST7_PHANO|nr:hypothetical protein SNOG_05177 [Parastagonospora nodorum SN15]EAT87568.1 hypothetical protein SNOG_05177 [Parastagonospora nodorum SN15]